MSHLGPEWGGGSVLKHPVSKVESAFLIDVGKNFADAFKEKSPISVYVFCYGVFAIHETLIIQQATEVAPFCPCERTRVYKTIDETT